MTFFSWLFKKKEKMATCPRCLGKGHVDNSDIKRLNMELKWSPGQCAYCNGVGKVSPQMVENVAVDEAYLTLELSMRERLRLINKDPEAILRAVSHEKDIDDFIEQIKYLHFNNHLDPDQIAMFYLDRGPDRSHEDYIKEKKELVSYISKVLEVK